MSSGVTVDPAVPMLFDEIKFKKTMKVAFFRLSDNCKSIIVDEERQIMACEKDAYGAFVNMLPKNDCRYIVFDVAYGTRESSDKTQLLFISWAPDTATIKSKMVHASSKGAIKKMLQLSIEWGLSELGDANINELATKLKGAVSVEGRELECK